MKAKTATLLNNINTSAYLSLPLLPQPTVSVIPSFSSLSMHYSTTFANLPEEILNKCYKNIKSTLLTASANVAYVIFYMKCENGEMR